VLRYLLYFSWFCTGKTLKYRDMVKIFFYLYGFIRFVPESPRWLLAMGRVEETMEVLEKASKINKHPLPANMDKILKQVS